MAATNSDSPALVSVVVPLYNRGRLITETLASLQGQSWSDIEIIVVDDGSDDGGPALVSSLASSDPRIRLLARPNDLARGAPACRNLGLRHSAGRFVVFLDSDDLMSADAIRCRVHLLETNPDCDLVVSQGLIFHAQPGDSSVLWNRCAYEISDLVERFLNQDIAWPNGGATWRREAINRIGAWNPKLACFQDWELHLRACILGLNIGVLPIPDVFVRRTESISQISQHHKAAEHVASRIEAMNVVVRLLGSTCQLTGRVKRAAKGFVLRNALALADDGFNDLAVRMLRSEAGNRLLSVIDRTLFRWILTAGPTWHWNTRVKRVADLWWGKIPYDSAAMQNGFMNTTHDGPAPAVAWSGNSTCD